MCSAEFLCIGWHIYGLCAYRQFFVSLSRSQFLCIEALFQFVYVEVHFSVFVLRGTFYSVCVLRGTFCSVCVLRGTFCVATGGKVHEGQNKCGRKRSEAEKTFRTNKVFALVG